MEGNTEPLMARRCGRPAVVAGCLVVAVVVATGIFFVVRQFSISSTSSQVLRSLPSGFLLGCSSSAYQVEGAWKENGKGESIWDNFTHRYPERIMDGSTGDVACDSYHQYKEDVRIIKETGFGLYRFSISWSRVLPLGVSDTINQAGLNYYHSLINELLDNGIQPMVTLYHWDLPQILQDIGGWTNPDLADHFLNFANLMFKEYGDKVKWWITINEGHLIRLGYGTSILAPGMNDSGVSDYQVTHNLLRGHAKVYRLYETTYKPTQQGKVGITNYAAYMMPLDLTSSSDKDAAYNATQFQLGMFTHPIFSTDGDYPHVVRARVDANSLAEGKSSSRLPSFTPQEVKDLKGSFDFFGLNHYFTYQATSGLSGRDPSIDRDSGVTLTNQMTLPEGFRKLLNWIRTEYDNPPVFVTENGCVSNLGLDDSDRVQFYHGFLQALLAAVYEDGCNIIGYATWTLMDNFEWFSGYTSKYGLWQVNFSDPLRARTMKQSAKFMQRLLTTRELPELPFTP